MLYCFFSSLLITLDSPYYAEIMRRGQYLSDHNRYMRLRRSASLRRSSSHHPRRQHEDRHSNLDSLASSNTDPAGRNNNFLNGVRPENAEQTILVDDVSIVFFLWAYLYSWGQLFYSGLMPTLGY